VKKDLQIALVGNPNSGKSSLFNALTGLNQKVGNFPGVTVDKKSGFLKLSNGKTVEITDLPGTYSLYPRSEDEQVTFNVLLDAQNDTHPDLVLVVADATNLRRNLLFITQIIDLGLPTALIINKIDLAKEQGMDLNLPALSKHLGIPVLATNARKGEGIAEMKRLIAENGAGQPLPFFYPSEEVQPILQELTPINSLPPGYRSFIYLCNHDHLQNISDKQHRDLDALISKHNININQLQARETVRRYEQITGMLGSIEKRSTKEVGKSRTEKIDRLLLHPVYGYLVFIGILFFIFQSIFSWSSWPMEFIETVFNQLGSWGSATLPDAWYTDLLVNGVLAGLGGIVIFIPQIVLLFLFLSLLEETGYMARVSFLMDKLMRKFGLNGKSVVPLIGGYACAVPSIMATRSINSWKERILTIMVLPLMSCSARLPVYTLLIGMTVPEERVLGLFNLQGLVMMAFYLLGFVAAIGSAMVMKWFIKERNSSFFLLEMPIYQFPRWQNVGLTLIDKAKAFVFGAGKIIIIISIVLWFMSSFGPGNAFEKLEQQFAAERVDGELSPARENDLNRLKLEHSYAGRMGKWMEPGIAPLGFDWKIGISLVTSFAAREVFVGTMATIYSLGSEDFEETTLREKMLADVHPTSGKPLYSTATTFSLMLFYAFAMQCMSTLAITYRETKSWKWPALQFFYMTGLAYLASLLAYQLLS
jgi:ferrous iron transport protein B